MFKAENYGKILGKDIMLYTIKNDKIAFSAMNTGATLVSIFTEDKNGKYADILLGFDNAGDFMQKHDYQGVIAGPYANRIGGGSFDLDGVHFELDKNEKGIQTLHGAGEFTSAYWELSAHDDTSLTFTYDRADGLGGFPGKMSAQVKYTAKDASIVIEYLCKTDRRSIINLTNHSYFNLGGFDCGKDILSHKLTINANKFTPVDENSIPTGELKSVDGTVFDFRNGRVIGDDINAADIQLEYTGGYDHNFCINGYDGKNLVEAAVCTDEDSGRKLTVLTDLPGIQFYAGNFLKGTTGKQGLPMNKRCGFCLETQYYPDTPHNPAFPQCVFDENKPFESVTVFKFN